MTTVQQSPTPTTEQPAVDHLEWLPGLRTLLRYRAAWLPGDLVAGLMVTALLVPAEMGWLSGGSGRGRCSGRRRRRRGP